MMFTSSAGSEDMIQAAEADIISPAVAAEDPDGLLGKGIPCFARISLAGVVPQSRLFKHRDQRLGSGSALAAPSSTWISR